MASKFIHLVLALVVFVAVSIAAPLEDNAEFADLFQADVISKKAQGPFRPVRVRRIEGTEDFYDDENLTAEKRGSKKIDCKF